MLLRIPGPNYYNFPLFFLRTCYLAPVQTIPKPIYPKECQPILEVMEQSLDTLQMMESATLGCLVPRELCTSTIAAIDGALRKLGPLCEPVHPVQEQFFPESQPMEDPYALLESPPTKNDGDVESGAAPAECEGIGEGEGGSGSPLRNGKLTREQYVAALIDDAQAAKDEEMFKEPVTIQNVGSQLDNAMRILDRCDLGLKAVPKAAAGFKRKYEEGVLKTLPEETGLTPVPKASPAVKTTQPKKKPLPSSSSGVRNPKKGKEKEDEPLDETTKKQLHSVTHLKLSYV